MKRHEVEGVIQFHVSVKVDASEMAGWRPETVAAFFDGIAKATAARNAGALEANPREVSR